MLTKMIVKKLLQFDLLKNVNRLLYIQLQGWRRARSIYSDLQI